MLVEAATLISHRYIGLGSTLDSIKLRTFKMLALLEILLVLNQAFLSDPAPDTLSFMRTVSFRFMKAIAQYSVGPVYRCTQCGAKLSLDKAVWVELSGNEGSCRRNCGT